MRSPENADGEHMISYLRAANVTDGELLLDNVMSMNFSPTEQRRYALKEGDVLVTEGSGSRGAVGAGAAWPGSSEPTMIQNTLLRLRARPHTDARFLYWWSRHAYVSGLYAAASQGLAIWHLGAERVRSLPFVDVELAQQRRIADFLDDQVSLLDRVRAPRAQSLLIAEAAYNGGVDSELNSQVKDFTPLKRLLAVSPSYGVLKPDRYEAPDGVPLVRTLDVTPEGTLRTDQLIKISPGQDVEYSRTRLQSGDIALSVVGTIGRSFISTEAHIGFNLSRALARVVPRPGVSSHWVRWWLNSQRFRDFVSVTCQGTAQSVLNMRDLVNFLSASPERRPTNSCDDWSSWSEIMCIGNHL